MKHILTYQAKGFVNQNRRGISKDKIGIACAIDEDGNYIVHTQQTEVGPPLAR